MKSIRIHRKAVQRIEAGHVWVYREEILDDIAQETSPSVQVCEERGRRVGSALLDAGSPIPLRLYSRKSIELGDELLEERLVAAVDWRRRTVAPADTGFRVVFSESDALPGLIVDRFGNGLAIQCTMRSYVDRLPKVIEVLDRCYDLDSIVAEAGGVRRTLRGTATGTATYRINGITMQADLAEGPKTGAFLDQRENYAAVREWIRKLGIQGRGLDLFSSTGGFALHMAQDLDQVDCVDSSVGAMESVKRNALLNGISNIRTIPADVKQYLKGLGQARKTYDVIVCDPPAFAKSKRHKEEALRAYYDLNLRSMATLSSSALFVSCSCSRNVAADDLLKVIRDSAATARKSLTPLEIRSQSIDHRVLLQIPETEYLKCMIFLVQAA